LARCQASSRVSIRTSRAGVLLLTGTGIVGGPEFSLSPGDVCRIEMDDLGVLENPVVSVGSGARS